MNNEDDQIHVSAFADQVYDLFLKAQIDDTPDGEVVIYTGLYHDPAAPEYLVMKDSDE